MYKWTNFEIKITYILSDRLTKDIVLDRGQQESRSKHCVADAWGRALKKILFLPDAFYEPTSTGNVLKLWCRRLKKNLMNFFSFCQKILFKILLKIPTMNFCGRYIWNQLTYLKNMLLSNDFQCLCYNHQAKKPFVNIT